MVRPVARSILLAWCIGTCDAHGFITKPVSRNTVVCDKLWPDYLKVSPPITRCQPYVLTLCIAQHYNTDNFLCKTDRESHCPPIPGKEKDCQGSSTGKYPGKGIPLSPFCSAGGFAKGGTGSKLKSSAAKDLDAHGPVQAHYTAGETVELEWQVAANHGGKYQYRICTDGSDTEECFRKNILRSEKGETWFTMDDKAKVGTKFKQTVRIPDNLRCERCTLSFRWDGLHESVIFASCADIAISGGGPTPSPPPGPHPKPPSPHPHPKPPSPHPHPKPSPPPSPPGTKSCPHCGGGACKCDWLKPGMCKGKTKHNCGSCCTCCCCGVGLDANGSFALGGYLGNSSTVNGSSVLKNSNVTVN